MLKNLFKKTNPTPFSGMVDIHCHILPDIDDGAKDSKTSLVMARQAVDDGISHIVTTPHIRGTLHQPDHIKKKCQAMNTSLIQNNLPLTVYPGAEVSSILSTDLIQRYTLNASHYILLEFPYTHVPDTVYEKITRLTSNGFYVIIAHPERNPAIIHTPDICCTFYEMAGVYLQLTAGSILGEFGSRVKKCCTYLLKNDWVSIIASDAHASVGRTPTLQKAAQHIEMRLGIDKALDLVKNNPTKIVRNIPIKKAPHTK